MFSFIDEQAPSDCFTYIFSEIGFCVYPVAGSILLTQTTLLLKRLGQNLFSILIVFYYAALNHLDTFLIHMIMFLILMVICATDSCAEEQSKRDTLSKSRPTREGLLPPLTFNFTG